MGTVEKIPPPELVDTTGAGDAFIGAVLYGMFYACEIVNNCSSVCIKEGGGGGGTLTCLGPYLLS